MCPTPGIVDLQLKFLRDELVPELELLVLPFDTLVPLEVSGQFLDGTPFSATDCVRLVGPSMAVESGLEGLWIDADPPDEFGDAGGFTTFGRAYPKHSSVTFTAPTTHGSWKFHGWLVDGDWITTPSIELFLDTEFQMIEPVYQEWIPPQRPIPEVEPEENNLDDDPPFQEVGL